MALTARYTPRVVFDLSGIDHAGDHIADLLLADLSVWQFFGECGLCIKEAFQLCLAGNATRGVGLQPFEPKVA